MKMLSLAKRGHRCPRGFSFHYPGYEYSFTLGDAVELTPTIFIKPENVVLWTAARGAISRATSVFLYPLVQEELV